VPKHLSFGDLEEANVRTVENDAGEVYVRPTDVFLDDEWLRCGGAHPPEKLGDYEEARKPSIP